MIIKAEEQTNEASISFFRIKMVESRRVEDNVAQAEQNMSK